MSNENRSLDIVIRTMAELGGAEKGVEHLEELIGKAKIAGKDFTALEAKLNTAKAAISQFKSTTDAAAQSLGKGGEAAEKTGHHIEGLHKLFHGLNEIVPGAGVLMQAAFSPIAATISIAVMALRYFKETLAETNKEFQRLEEEAAKPFDHRLDAVRDGVINTASALGRFNDQLQEAAHREITAKEAIDETVAALRRQQAEAQANSQGLMTNDLARLNAMHAAGIVKEREYEREKLAIELHYQQEKRRLEEQGLQDEIDIRKKGVKDAEANQDELKKVADAAIVDAGIAGTKLAGLNTPEELRKKKDEADKALKEWGHSPDDYNGNREKAFNALEALPPTASADDRFQALWRHGQGGAGVASEEIARMWADEYNTLKTAQRDWAKQLETGPGDYAKAKVEAATAQATAESKSRAALENEDETRKGNREIQQRQAELDQKRKSDTEADRLDRETAEANVSAKDFKTPAGRDMDRAGRLADSAAGGGELNQQDRAFLMDMMRQFYGNDKPSGTIAGAVDLFKGKAFGDDPVKFEEMLMQYMESQKKALDRIASAMRGFIEHADGLDWGHR